MLKLRITNLAVGIICGMLAITALFAPRVFAGDQSRGLAQDLARDQAPDGEKAAELLEDGLDALSDHAEESGRRLLGRVVSDFPGSVEALRAKRVLAALDRGESIPDDRALIRAGLAERTAEYRRVFLVDVGDRVFFAENSASLGGRARNIIENQARWLSARPDLSIVVIGRADDAGGRAAAAALSLQRAEAVRDRLVAAGISENRIEVKAAGNADRVAVCDGPLCQAQNRNAEVYIKDWRLDRSWQSRSALSDLPQRTVIGPVSGARREAAQAVSQ